MATTTGLYNTIPVSRDQIILDALQDLRVVDQTVTTATLNANDIAVCLTKLNFILKKFSIKGLLLWSYDEIQVPLVANQTSYTIGPVGNVVTYRPLRILEGSFIRQIVGGFTQDTSLQILSRIEYKEEAGKGSTGVVNSIYYDPQMGTGAYNPTNAQGVLYVFVTPSDNSRTIFLQVQRPIQDIVNSTDVFDMPFEWYYALSKALAEAVADKYEIPENRIARIKGEARQALEEIADWGATEQAPLTFRPDYRMGYRR